jgi:hypothetical protein
MLPFASGSGPAPIREASIAQIRGEGRLRVEELTLAPLSVTKLDANAEIDGRNVRLVRAQADFYGGRISGDFGAIVSAEPTYSFHGAIDRVNLALLAGEAPLLAGQFAGLASGELKLTAKGVGRQSLLGSLQGDGALRVRDAVVPIVNAAWSDTSEGGAPDTAGISRFATGTAAFRVVDGSVRFDPLRLAAKDYGFDVRGSVDFSRRLDLRVKPLVLLHGVDSPSRGTEMDVWDVGGTLTAPEVSRQTHVAGNAVATGH